MTIPVTAHMVWRSWAASRGLFLIGMAVVWTHWPAALPADVSGLYFTSGRALARGSIPYLDFSYEYPPGSLAFTLLAYVIGGHTALAYTIVWALLMLLVDALIVGLLSAPAGLLWVTGVFVLGPVALLRNDLLVVVAFVYALRWSARQGSVRGGAAWAFGALVKLWPLAPLGGLLLLALARGEVPATSGDGAAAPGGRGNARMLAGATGLTLAAVVPLGLTHALIPMIRFLFQYQGSRPVEVESLWATPAWLAHLAGTHRVVVVHTYGSYNLKGSGGLARIATLVTAVLQVVCALGPLTVAILRRRRPTPLVLAWIFCCYIAIVLLLAPVLSTQYLLWLLAGICVVITSGASPSHLRPLIALTLAAAGLTQLIYPLLFTLVQTGNRAAVLVLLTRNVVLVAVGIRCVLGLAAEVRRMDPVRRESPTPIAV